MKYLILPLLLLAVPFMAVAETKVFEGQYIVSRKAGVQSRSRNIIKAGKDFELVTITPGSNRARVQKAINYHPANNRCGALLSR